MILIFKITCLNNSCLFMCVLHNFKFQHVKVQHFKVYKFKLDLCWTSIILCFQHFTISNLQFSKTNTLNTSQIQNIVSSSFQITLPGFHFGVPKKHDVATQLISYERYGEILFQKVALCYLLHFVQDGASTKRTIKLVFLQHSSKPKIFENSGNNPYIFPP